MRELIVSNLVANEVSKPILVEASMFSNILKLIRKYEFNIHVFLLKGISGQNKINRIALTAELAAVTYLSTLIVAKIIIILLRDWDNIYYPMVKKNTADFLYTLKRLVSKETNRNKIKKDYRKTLADAKKGKLKFKNIRIISPKTTKKIIAWRKRNPKLGNAYILIILTTILILGMAIVYISTIVSFKMGMKIGQNVLDFHAKRLHKLVGLIFN